MTAVKCSSCGQTYLSRNIRILGHHHDLWFLSAFCPACHTQYLVAASVEGGKLPVVTDLTEAELSRFRHATTLTADDVLDMHCFLRQYEGDLARLLGRERVG